MALKQKNSKTTKAATKFSKKSSKVSKKSKNIASKVLASNNLDLSDIVNAAALAGKAKSKSRVVKTDTSLGAKKMLEDHEKDKEMISFVEEETEKTQNLLDKLDLI